MGKEQNNEYYNKVFEASKVYHQPWDEVDPSYKTLWSDSVKLLQKNNINNILDIGCGMGQMSELAYTHNIQYKGIDFSEYAIKFCKNKNHPNQIFEVADALKYKYDDEVEGYVTHEFLEHIEGDLQILSNLKPNKFIVLSVPDFDYEGHVRWFGTLKEVQTRYSPYIKDFTINKVTPRHYLGWGYTI